MYDEGLAERIRDVLEGLRGISEKKMFGGVAFMLHGNMCAGVIRDGLMVRVGPGDYPAALKEPHAREMDFTGKPLKGFVIIDPDGLDSDGDLARWVGRGLAFARTLPDK